MGSSAITAPLVGIVGWSGSGKTSLLEALLPRLLARGLRVNIIKHSHHDIALEPPQKDSARLRAAGAAEVMLATPYRYAIVHELRDEDEPSFEDLLARMQPADLTLIEGYKWLAIPKLEVYRPSLGKAAFYQDDANVVAVASDGSAPDDLSNEIDWLHLNQLDEVLSWLLAFVRSSGRVS